jgi:5-methylcytosine-specific restriction endonuclease McrA
MTTPNTICLFPHFAPITAYNRGCRCSRCKQEKKQIAAVSNKKNQAKVVQRRIEYRKSPEGKAWAAAYWRTSEYKARKRSQLAAWRQTPHGKAVSAANCAKRRARKRKQSPKLNDTEQQQVIAIYKRCQDLTESTGIQHHVDHIIPLSKEGEHHPDNLQILTAEENMKKGDRILP